MDIAIALPYDLSYLYVNTHKATDYLPFKYTAPLYACNNTNPTQARVITSTYISDHNISVLP